MSLTEHRGRRICLSVLCLLPVLLQWPDWLGWLSQNPIYSIFPGLTPSGPDPLLDGAPWVDGNAAVTMQALGRGVVRAWVHGEIPWWNHDAGAGLPLAAAMQPGAFFLPFILLLGRFDGLLLLKVLMQAIAGVATYGLLRTLGLGRWAACLGGILFQLNGSFAFFSDAPIMPAPFLPMLLLAIERCVRRTRAGLAGGWGLVAVALGFSVVACFPEMAYLDGLLALAWSLLRFVQLDRRRRQFAGKLIGGSLLALMVTLPATQPFIQYLTATGGIAHRAAANLGLQAPGYAMLLMPALYGPPFWAQRYPLWDTFVGGYLDLALVLLLFLGVCLGSLREPGLRRMLGLWIALAMLKVAGAPIVTPLLNHLPLMRMVQFFRYGQLGIDMAAVVLAAFVLDGWDRGKAAGLLSPGQGALAAVGTGVLSLAALAAARPTIRSLLEVPSYGWFLAGSIAWAAAVGLLLLGLLAGQPGAARRVALAALLVVNASALFSVPLLAGAQNRTLDLGGIAFLRAHLGQQRVYTMGPMAPNYGTFFGVAEINYNSVIVPGMWVDYIHRHLDPDTDPALFNGTYPAPSADREAAFRRNEAAYAAIGVRYVLRPAAPALHLLPFGPWRPLQPHPLADGQSLRLRIPGSRIRQGTVGTVQFEFGLYGRHGDGTLALRMCQQDRCGAGSASLATAVDNAALTMTLDKAIILRAGVEVTMELRRRGGASPVAAWFDGPAPLLSLDYLVLEDDPPPVYYGSAMRIDPVPGTAAYASAPGCTLRLGDRDRMTAACASPSRLTRLELDYPGWRASVGSRAAAISRTGEIFQSVPLPAGRSVIRFVYRPPGEAVAWWTAVCGLLLACGFGLARLPPRVSTRPSRPSPPCR